jgi:hypothetical protein
VPGQAVSGGLGCLASLPVFGWFHCHPLPSPQIKYYAQNFITSEILLSFSASVYFLKSQVSRKELKLEKTKPILLLLRRLSVNFLTRK